MLLFLTLIGHENLYLAISFGKDAGNRWRLLVERSATFLGANRIGWEILSHLQRSI